MGALSLDAAVGERTSGTLPFLEPARMQKGLAKTQFVAGQSCK